MALGTFSKFYYGYQITASNYKFDFNEGSGEVTAEIDLGIYTPTDLASALKISLDAAGNKTYFVTFDRSTRAFTIACDSGTFSILINTGTNKDIGCYDVLGFTGNVDLTGVGTYTGDASGSVYYPQFWLQDYTSPNDWNEKIDASINVSSSGVVEVVSFGDVSFTEFNIKFITDRVMDNIVIRNNQNGVSDANDFLTFCINRGPIEFMPDKDQENQFYKLTLESTRQNSKGVGYKLQEETSQNLPGFYNTGLLKFRVG